MSLKDHFSYSQMKTFAICPRKYAYQQQWWPEPLAEPLILGSAVHKAIENVNHAVLARAKVEPTVQDHFVTAFGELKRTIERAPIPPAPGEFDIEALAKEASVCVGTWQTSVERLRKVSEVERPHRRKITVNREEYVIVARPDAIYRYDYEGPAPLIIDYKTSGRPWTDFQHLIETQHAFYAWVIDEPVTARHEVITKPTKTYPVRIQTFNHDIREKQMQEAEDELIDFIKHRELKIRNRGQHCGYCAFAPDCLGSQAAKLLEDKKDERLYKRAEERRK